MQNYFELFQISQTFAIDNKKLKERYLELQLKYHPDKATDQDQRMQFTKYCEILNDGYATLSAPFKRARHILELNNYFMEEIASNDMIELTEIWQEMEDLEDATPHDLRTLLNKKNSEKESLMHCLNDNFKQQYFTDAVFHATKLRYVEKIIELITQKIS
ncbi:Co-chaperone protein HscB [Rickettsiales endosymbiont of Paramecium tredecaurelia]|uniref:Fe-S protein assembly co-chaperone HscB n=1 Tax=Candidatus Sarmatiella mevalonica TaxID=2770581 RepID=UPI001924E0AB|nr:Fe-S protein assembly co-chaperone HscB [Candidatus Sarmatiella mevalonica]MBL3285124.1 Co-chaperone protein HscB [Candidatus Sarmatiella mevalonica]